MIKFLAIGPPKSGTTYMQSLLIQHPNIFLSEKKEIQFFNYNLDKGIDWYHQHFSKRKHNQIVGEISPTYCDSFQTLKTIKEYSNEYSKDLKIIFSFRDPLKRLLSEYHHHIRKVNYDLPIQKVLEIEASGKDGGKYFKIIRNSNYYQIMSELLTLFDSENILIINSDDELYNKANLINTLRRIEKFLGIDEYSAYDLNVESNSSYVPRSYLIQRLVFQDNIFKRSLKKCIPVFSVREKIRKFIRDINLKSSGVESYDTIYKVNEDLKNEIFEIYLKDDFENFNSLILKSIHLNK